MNATKLCLISLTASHYRKLIYSLMDAQLGCDFIFGKQETTVKQLDITQLRKAQYIPNEPIGTGRWYKMPGAQKLMKGYDVVINDMGILCTSSWWYMLQSKFHKQKVYLWDHGWYGREGFFKKWMKRVYFGLADGAFIYGDHARNLMIENGFDGSKLHVIHNSLDYDAQLVLRNKIRPSGIYTEHFGNTNPVLVMIGRLNLRKHLDMLIYAIEKLSTQGKLYNVVLIGDGEDRNKLEKLAKERDVENQVWFYGACYDEKTNAELIYNADMCVVPGDIGLTAMHSMMFGCPAMSHNYYPNQGPEFEAIQEGKTGTFFEHGSIDSLAESISRWFAEKISCREEVRQSCYKEVDENWNPHKQIEIIKRVIESE